LRESRTDPHEPAVLISWYDAARYCRWLSEQEGVDESQMCFPPIGRIENTFAVPENYLERTGYRLPTEAEWEYACRGGTTSVRPYGHDEALLGDHAWYFVNSGNQPHPVGQKMPNAFGLFDMLGNAYEWCFDQPATSRAEGEGPVKDRVEGTEVNETQTRVIRGGAFHRGPLSLRSASRQFTGIADRHRNTRIGFRIVRTIRNP
jgi:formylglycine-generating enzyme required for sulfatase activity